MITVASLSALPPYEAFDASFPPETINDFFKGIAIVGVKIPKISY